MQRKWQKGRKWFNGLQGIKCCNDNKSVFVQSNFATVFSYGENAKHQLKALAINSDNALQSVAVSCNKMNQPIRMHGWNGQVMAVKDYTSNIDYSLGVEQGCEVIIPTVSLFQQYFFLE